MGLSIVDSIIKEYGYKINIESKENEGTSIKISYPLNKQ